MLDLQLQYDPNVSIGQYTSGEQKEPGMVASHLKAGLIPVNLVQITDISTNFRDAVIYTLVTTADAGSDTAENVLKILSAAVASTPDGLEESVRIYSEYLASLSFVWGETVLATRAVLRNNPEKTKGSFLSVVANALYKKMNSEMFKSLLLNNTAHAVSLVPLERAQGKY